MDLYGMVLNSTLYDTSYNIMMIGNFMEIAFETPRLPTHGGSYCLSDFHCFNNGKCDSIMSGFPECICDSMYVGDFCQVKVDEYVITKNLTGEVIEYLDYYFINHTYADLYLNTDLEFLVMLLKGLVKNYETISPL